MTFNSTNRPKLFALLHLSDESQDKIASFFIDNYEVSAEAILRDMHLTFYYGELHAPVALTGNTPVSISLDLQSTRFMLMKPGGEIKQAHLIPCKQKIGIRIQASADIIPEIRQLRSQFTELETPQILGNWKPSSNKHNAFGARNFQPHITLLRQNNNIPDDLSNIGIAFRETIQQINFSHYSVRNM